MTVCSEKSKILKVVFRRKQEERGRLEATWAGDWGEQQQQRASVLSIHRFMFVDLFTFSTKH